MVLFQGFKGRLNVFSGGNRISSRITNSSGGKTVSIDGIIGVDGIPIGVERRGKNHKERKVTGKERIKYIVFYRSFSIAYWVFVLFVGSWWSGWLS